jgi:hypothetical protein
MYELLIIDVTSLQVAGLPDGIFSKQKTSIWVKFGGSCNGR